MVIAKQAEQSKYLLFQIQDKSVLADSLLALSYIN